ncbi:PREDICTED: protein BREAST CANCER SUSCEPTIBILITY 1 homolog [Tarenaya hassleriana]|uniref:protein BREAST CANCER SUSCEPTIBILITY 1 homolog n=1 Tax=Tarenaya hassleriana TaxID=28532 RepID=UPI00053C119B|nr:PREDICTED: protein BREAST CANCER SUSCEPTIBILITY 1 homolog [Tarenaya hassleriana]
MGDIRHLERMGRELKCPICLSLLNCAASLTCNHVFCNACIVKSMKTDATCPVCKVPYHRRDIRAAPHMDSLVGIYKSMEVASGVNIFVSQNIPSSKNSSDKEKHAGTDSKYSQKVTNEICQVASKGRTSKGKGPRKNEKENLDAAGPIVLKPSSQTKKRVQLPQHPSSENATKFAESTGRVGIVKDDTTKTLISSNEDASPNKVGKLSLSPFFWLRDEDAEENISQFTESDDLYCTPVDVPSFSDLKDSDHESPTKGDEQENPAPMDIFDSEMFEWTQRPCSPEILPSPVKAKVPDSIESDQSGRKISKVASGKSTNRMHEAKSARNKNAMLCSGVSKVSPAGMNLGDKQAITGASNQRNRNPKKNAKVSRAKQSKDHGSGVQMGVATSEESDGKVGVIDGKKGTKRKRSISKASEDQPVARSSDLGNGDQNQIQGLSDTESGKQTSGNFCKKKRERKLNAISLSPIDLSQSLGNPSVVGLVGGLTKAGKKKSKAKNPKKCLASSARTGDTDILASNENSAKKVSTLRPSMTSSRRRQSNRNGIFRDELTHVDQDGDGYESKNRKNSTEDEDSHTTKVRQNCSEPSGHDLPLRRCEVLANKFPCAFCHSSEDSEASGEMAHYYKGQPVSADYDGGSKVIHVHKNCAEWAPNVYFEDFTAVNLEAELTRSKRISCSCCGLKGAALGCYYDSCKRSFHVSCAKLIPECRWDSDNFVMLCPLHASTKLPCEKTCPKQRRHMPSSEGQLHSQSNQVAAKSGTAPQDRRLHGLSKKLILCCSGLALEERAVVSEFSSLPGVVVLRKWESRVTHVIASTDESRACKRTLKVLKGILEGKWILSIDWVKACLKDMKYVNEEQYEIATDVHGIQDGPRLGRERAMNKQPKLFDGLKFYITGDFDPVYKGYLQDLVVAAGGSILRRRPIPPLATDLVTLSESSTIIVYSLEPPDNIDPDKNGTLMSRRKSEAEALAKSAGAGAVSSSWIMDSIAASKLQGLH